MASDSSDRDKERLQQLLQMDDLGSRRRDIISTEDTRTKYNRVSLDQINAQRAINQVGSKVQQLAEQNKEKLNSWSNAWKDIGDDVDLEDLDPLMNGQSHRARLADQVRDYGGQSYAEEEEKSRPRGAPRGPRGGGRGGGVVGTRGRGGHPMALRSADRYIPRSASESKIVHHKVTNRNETPRRQVKDPALIEPDPNFHEHRHRSGRNRAGPSHGERNAPPNKPDNRPNKAPTVRRPVPPSHQTNYEYLLAGSDDFMAAVSNMSGNAAPASAAPAYDENSTLFSQGRDTSAKPTKVEEPPKKGSNKNTPKKDKKENASKKDVTPNKASASKAPKTPRKNTTPKNQQNLSASKADNKKQGPSYSVSELLGLASQAESCNEMVPKEQKLAAAMERQHVPATAASAVKATPVVEAKTEVKATSAIQEAPVAEETSAIEATDSNIEDTEPPKTPNGGPSSFASSLPQPADEDGPGGDSSPDDHSDLLLDFSTPPSPKDKGKAPMREADSDLGQLLDVTCRPVEDVFMGGQQSSNTYEGMLDAESLSAYPSMMGMTADMLDKQRELEQLVRLLDQAMSTEQFDYLNSRRGTLEAQLIRMKKDYDATKATIVQPKVIKKEEPEITAHPEVSKAEKMDTKSLVDANGTNVQAVKQKVEQPQNSSVKSDISGLKVDDLIGTHLLPGRTRDMGQWPVDRPGPQPRSTRLDAWTQGHERKSTTLSQGTSTTETSDGRMRSAPYIPSSAATRQYASAYFEAQDKAKEVEELQHRVSTLSLDSPKKATGFTGTPATRPDSPTPAPRSQATSSSSVARATPYFPDTAATRQYSGNFSAPKPQEVSNASIAKSTPSFPATAATKQYSGNTSATGTQGTSSSSGARTTPSFPDTAATRQYSGNFSAPKPQETSSSSAARITPSLPDTAATRQYSGGFTPFTFPQAESSKGRGSNYGQHTRTISIPTSEGSQGSVQKSKLSPTVPPFQPSNNAPKPKANEQKVDNGVGASKYATTRSLPRSTSGLEASKYAVPAAEPVSVPSGPPRFAYSPQRAPSQGIEASQYAASQKRKASQGLETSKYAQPAKRAPAQSLEASKYAAPMQSQSGQGMEASTYASASTFKPEQGLSVSKYASSSPSKPSQGLETSKYAVAPLTWEQRDAKVLRSHKRVEDMTEEGGLMASKHRVL
ncbi:hypothetical protein FQN54_009617 [Arachnomyces sp. PD_36]|nr:hypothetical protein FQN54_009617 [Arachnomyces sp. PD_36]